MNIFRRIALQSMKRNRVRTAVTVIGVILSTAMFTAVTTFCTTLLAHLVRTEAYEHGAYYLSFSAVDHSTVQQMAQDKETDALVQAEYIGYSELLDSEFSPYAYVLGIDEAFSEMMPVHLLDGSLPQNGTETLVPEHIQFRNGLDVELGSTLTLALGDRIYDGQQLWQNSGMEAETLEIRETRTYTVVGFYERPDFESSFAPGYTFLTAADGTGTGIYDVYVRLNSPSTSALDAFQEKYTQAAPGGTDTNWSYLRTQGNLRYSNYNRFLFTFGGILILLIMIGSVSMIYSAFSISVSERTRQFGLLSSIGATKTQVRRTVLYEALVVSCLGIPLGLLAGCGGMFITFLLLGDQMSSLFAGASFPMRFTVSPLSLLLAALIALSTVVISALIPARRAMHVTAIEAIRQSQDIKTEKHSSTSGKLAYKLFGLPGMLSKKYFRRSRKKYRATVISLAMSVLLFVTASTFGMYLTESVNENVRVYSFDFAYEEPLDEAALSAVAPALREAEGIEAVWYADSSGVEFYPMQEEFSESFLAYQANMERVSGAAPVTQYESVNASVFYIDDITFQTLLSQAGITDYGGGALLYDRDQYVYYDEAGENRYVYNGTMLDGTVTALRTAVYPEVEGYYYAGTEEVGGERKLLYLPEVVADETPSPVYLDPQYRDTPIAGRLETAPFGDFGVSLYLPLHTIDEPQPTLYINADNTEQAKQSVKAVFQNCKLLYKEAALFNVQEANRGLRDQLTVIRVFSYGFIVLISLICVANVFNTISTNVALRRRDFAMLRSVGMTAGGMNRMVRFECLLYGIRALLIGLPLSVLLSLLMFRASVDVSSAGFRLSWSAVAIAVVSVFFVVFVSMMYAMRKIKRDNPVDALKSEMT